MIRNNCKLSAYIAHAYIESMVRILFLLLICLSGKNVLKAAPIKVVTTTSFLADMAKEIAGSWAEVESMLPVGQDPHIYEPIPGDAKKVAEAQLVIKNGLTLEGWLGEMIESSGTKALIITASDGIVPIQSADHVGAYDPHAWMDVSNVMKYIANIRDALIRLDPVHSPQYEENYQRYYQQLKALDNYIAEKVLSIPSEQRVLITTHDAFRYYGNKYGLTVKSAMGTSTDAQATISDFAHLRKLVLELGIPAIFIESTINPDLLKQLAEDLGIVIGGELFADSLGDEESGADTYIKMLKQNTDLIVAGLSLINQVGENTESFLFLWVILGLFILSFFLVMVRLRIPSIEGLSWENYTLNIEGLSVSYDRKTVLSNVYITVEPGKVYGLLGGNGSGKSTLFKSILGLIPIDAGNIKVHNQAVETIRKYVSYIPQKEEIDWTFPATVMDVVLLGRYPHRKVFEPLKIVDRKKANEALEMLGIQDLKDKQIGELSGGQQQRVFIARALCQEAEIYLFDEPFVGVDITTEAKIMEIVKSLAAEGKMVIIIHHDLAKVKEYFDRLIMINQRLVAIGETDEVFTDDNIKKTYGGRLTILQKAEKYL